MKKNRINKQLFASISLLILTLGVVAQTATLQPSIKPSAYQKFTKADRLIGEYGKFRKNNDVHFYEISIDVDHHEQTLNGWVEMHFTALEDMQTIQIDLVKELMVISIEQNGNPLSYTRKHGAVFVKLEKPLAKGESASIRTYYGGKAMPAKRPPWEGGMVWEKTKNGEPWIGVACEGIGSSVWWPSKDQLLDEPDSVLMHITVDEGLFVVSNGRLQNRELKNGKETFTWKSTYTINNYNVTFYAGPYEHFQLPYPKEDTIYYLDFYVLPENLEKAKEHFVQTIEIIRYFEESIGEYPWWRDGFKLVESPYAGMEHQTAIAYGNGYENEDNYDYDHIILHEAIHEWWGNCVSAGDYAEIWLHEGITTYSEALFLEHVYGKEMYYEHLKKYSYYIRDKYPVIGPYNLNFWHKEDSDVYMKGALMLHTLREIIDNDSLFFDILKTFYQQNKYGIATTNGFIILVNEKTGKDYTWFFKAYLYQSETPRLLASVSQMPGGQNAMLNYKWANVDSDFNLPVTIFISGKEYTLYPSTKVQTMQIKQNDRIRFNPWLLLYRVKEVASLN